MPQNVTISRTAEGRKQKCSSYLWSATAQVQAEEAGIEEGNGKPAKDSSTSLETGRVQQQPANSKVNSVRTFTESALDLWHNPLLMMEATWFTRSKKVKHPCGVFTGFRLPPLDYLQIPVRTNACSHHPPPVLFLCQSNQVLEGFPSIHKT